MIECKYCRWRTIHHMFVGFELWSVNTFPLTDAFEVDELWKQCDNVLNCIYNIIIINETWCILTHLQETTFENIVTKWEIAQNEQFLLLKTMFSTSFSNYTFIYGGIPCFCLTFFKVVCCRCVVFGKGLTVKFEVWRLRL